MLKIPKKHKFEFLVLEQKPKDSNHPQGNRVLKCLEFSSEELLLEGEPRFDRFKATLSIPQNGERVETEVLVVSTNAKTANNIATFAVKFTEPSEHLISLLGWWDRAAQQVQQPSLDQDLGIDV